jgi:hypothetical protein
MTEIKTRSIIIIKYRRAIHLARELTPRVSNAGAVFTRRDPVVSVHRRWHPVLIEMESKAFLPSVDRIELILSTMIMTTTKSCRRGVLGTPPREKGADLEGVLEVAVIKVGHCQACRAKLCATRPSLVPIGDDDKNRVI